MRRIVLTLLCMFAAWTAIASDLPKISENGNEYWYYLKFTQGSYVVASDGDGVVCKSAIPTGLRSQLWKVEGSATSGYTMTNKLGLTLYAVATSQGSEIRASQTPGGLNKFRFNTRGNYYTITPYSNTAQALNCWGGMGMGNDIKLYDSSDANAPMEFVGEYAAASITPAVGVIPYPRFCGLTDCGTLDMHNLLSRCTLVLTDSGGLQEEAPALGVPVLVLRGETERPEAVEAGCVRLAGTTAEGIFYAASRLLSDEQERLAMAHAVSPYGDGHASEKIADILTAQFTLGEQAG